MYDIKETVKYLDLLSKQEWFNKQLQRYSVYRYIQYVNSDEYYKKLLFECFDDRIVLTDLGRLSDLGIVSISFSILSNNEILEFFNIYDVGFRVHINAKALYIDYNIWLEAIHEVVSYLGLEDKEDTAMDWYKMVVEVIEEEVDTKQIDYGTWHLFNTPVYFVHSKNEMLDMQWDDTKYRLFSMQSFQKILYAFDYRKFSLKSEISDKRLLFIADPYENVQMLLDSILYGGAIIIIPSFSKDLDMKHYQAHIYYWLYRLISQIETNYPRFIFFESDKYSNMSMDLELKVLTLVHRAKELGIKILFTYDEFNKVLG